MKIAKQMKSNFSNDAVSQRRRILARLQKGAATTIELRHKEGFNIVTQWLDDVNPGGGVHKVAYYVLRPGTYQGAGHAR